MTLHQALRLAGPLLLALALSACGSAESRQNSTDGTGGANDPAVDSAGGGAEASCALMVTYDGHSYLALGVDVAPVEGNLLQGATIPPCNDTGELAEPEDPEQVGIAELPGVSPSVAVLLQGRDDVVLVRDDVDHDELPQGVKQLLRAPRCDPSDAPIDLHGAWLGIVTPDETTEDDLVPPYDLEVSVDESSIPRYERARLTIRVPSDLGRPLTREDLQTSLWEGGTISITARCDGGQYVATHVEAHAPS